MKLAEPPRIDEDIRDRFREIAKEVESGRVTDYVMVYLSISGEPCFSHSYRTAKRAQIIGLLEILKNDLVTFFEVDE